MEVIRARNVHCALPTALRRLGEVGVPRESRNGPVLVFPTPVTTVYERPEERVLFHEERDANPFLHLFESLWMLAGRNDIKFLTRFTPGMANFSDDGVTMHGAYGHRWRQHFQVEEEGSYSPASDIPTKPVDQPRKIIDALRVNPDDRRCVLGMWDPAADLGRAGKDVPCNTHAFIAVNTEGKVDLTVLNRSNDMIWGAYGANAVHFSVLQEFFARALGREVGTYYQVSNNLHAYLKTLEPVADLPGVWEEQGQWDPYDPKETPFHVAPHPLMQTPLEDWLLDLQLFMDVGPTPGLRDPFFTRVAQPMWHAHTAYRDKKDPDRYKRALEILQQCKAEDWGLTAQEWIRRREAASAAKSRSAA